MSEDRVGVASGPGDDLVQAPLRRVLKIVLALNLAYFVVEASAAAAVASVSLFADSVDFLEDASLNLLILVGLRWSARGRARLGLGLAGILLVPGLATLWTAGRHLLTGAAPPGAPLTLVGLGALAVNATCAWVLARHAAGGGSLLKAAFLSARNDVIANVAIIATGLVTAVWRSAWPDLVVGLAIGLLNAGAAWEVCQAARAESRARIV